MKEVDHPKIYTVKLSEDQIDAIFDAFRMLTMIDSIETEWGELSTQPSQESFTDISDSFSVLDTKKICRQLKYTNNVALLLF